MKANSWLVLEKKVKFGDCDSAGVIHFHNLFRWAHESWEESMEISNHSRSKTYFLAGGLGCCFVVV